MPFPYNHELALTRATFLVLQEELARKTKTVEASSAPGPKDVKDLEIIRGLLLEGVSHLLKTPGGSPTKVQEQIAERVMEKLKKFAAKEGEQNASQN